MSNGVALNMVKMMVLGLGGTSREKAASREFFGQPQNKFYRSEFMPLAKQAAMLYPMTRNTVVHKLGLSSKTYRRAKQALKNIQRQAPSRR